MASPSLLTRLPDELLGVVLSYIGDDIYTLDSLCAASRGSSNFRLQEASLIRRWQRTTIDDCDLLPEPGDKQVPTSKKEHKRHKLNPKPARQDIRTMLMSVRPGCRPANYVQELVFDLRLFKYYEAEIGDVLPHGGTLMPKISWFQYNLQRMTPYLINLRTIIYLGELPQEILDAITSSQRATQIRNLALQRFYGQPWVVSTVKRDFMTPQRRPVLDYVDLWQLDHLRSLEVHRLAHAEVPIFCALLPSLSRLEKLLVGDETMDWRGRHGDPAGCGMRIFLEHIIYGPKRESEEIYQSEKDDSDEMTGFPPTLTSLTLMDRHAWQSFAQTQPRLPLVNYDTPLTALHLDIDGLEYITLFTQCLKAAELRRLTITGSTMPYQKPSHFDGVHDVVATHQETLQEIKLLQAWTIATDFGESFNERWQGRFSIQELVLGSQSYTWMSIPQEQWRQQPSPALAFYLNAYNAYVQDGHSGQWGTQLKRVRIDHIQLSYQNLPNLDSTVLSQARFADLKILMLQPFDEGPIPEEEGSQTFWSCKLIDSSTAQHLASDIAKNASSALRVVVLQNYWYWISNGHNTGSGSKAWRWVDAEKDHQENKLMREVLSKADWSFLQATIPLAWNARFRPENKPQTGPSFRPYSPQEISHQWNTIVALPVGD